MTVRVFMDGAIVEPQDARVSVFDRGFLYGDSVYEVLRTYGGNPLAVAQHLARLRRSGNGLGFEMHWSDGHLRHALAETLGAAGNDESYARIMCTRGAGAMGLATELAVDPRLIIIVRPVPEVPAQQLRDGITVALVSIVRNPKNTVDPSIKSGNYLNNILALREARQRGAMDAIMLDTKGRVAEGSASNIFAVHDGRVRTPPLEVGILEGVTRGVLFEICASADIECAAEEIARHSPTFNAHKSGIAAKLQAAIDDLT